MNSHAPARSGDQQPEWPVRSGSAPPLADAYVTRPESAPDLNAALVPGTTVVLAPGHGITAQSREWLGTCGKTQLAVAFAQNLWQLRQLDLLAWVCAASRASVLSGFVAAGAAVGTGTAGAAEAAAARFISWLGATTRPWLLVLDDLRDAADLDGLWPQGTAGGVLITTAGSETVANMRQPLVVPMGAFSTHEALGYLMGRLTADPDQRLGAIDLVDDLGCEPMALAQASAVIASSDLSCRQYQEIFARRRRQLTDAADRAGPAAAITWALSAEHAARLSPEGIIQPLLALLALLDGQAIPETVFSTQAAHEYLAAGGAVSAADSRTTWGSLLSLERVGLLTVDTGTQPRTVRVSPVVQQAIRTTLPDALLGRAARAAAYALLQAWPENEPDGPLAWPTTGLLACTARLQEIAGTTLWETGELHPLLLQAGRSLDSGRLTGPAVAYWTDITGTSDRILGPGSPDTLTAGSHLASALASDGQVTEAVSWARWALASRARVLGAEDPETNSARVSLGHALIAAGQPVEAIAVLEAAAGNWERTRGADNPDTLSVRDELAAAYTAAGKRSEAIELYQVTLRQRERVQGPRDPDTLVTRQRLADAYLAEGRIKDGISQYRRVISDRERVLGPDHPDTIAACASLADAYHQSGRMANAVELFQRAYDGYERVLGPDHPDTLAASAKLAAAYYAVGRLGDAGALLRETVSRCERVLPPGDPLTKVARDSLKNIAG
jgi:tetratricopeptide (TPR) repeat protein